MNRLRRRAARTTAGSLPDRFFGFLYRRSTFDRWLFSVVALVFLVSGGIWLWQYSAASHVMLLSDGGTLHEGVVGAPRFVNPVLATTRADQDMVALLFRGLMRYNTEGALVPDLAESVTVSDDGLTYNVVLKTDALWHDGVALTAEDIIFTIGLVQDPELRSPIRGNWNDVVVEQLGTHELNIILNEPYSPFSENLTLGILPRHLWQNFGPDEFPFSEYNTEPVGSGHYALQEVIRDQAGLISRYDLTQARSSEQESHIAAVSIHFFATEAELATALEESIITHTAALQNDRVATLSDTYTVYEAPLPRVFALYPNQNRNPVLRDLAAREALSLAIDRTALIDTVLAGYGEATHTPLPVGFGFATSTPSSSLEAATTALLAGGWEQTIDGGWEKEIDEVTVPLFVTIATANTPLFEATAEAVKTAWNELGVDVGIALYEQSDLVQAVIRPRDYELLLFGTDIGRALDLYPFWHSSQREDPGLNIALYTSITADDHLETYRITSDTGQQRARLESFVAEIQVETPAIFLFNPTMTYVTSATTDLTLPQRLGKPSDRFATINEWYIEATSLWPFISKLLD